MNVKIKDVCYCCMYMKNKNEKDSTISSSCVGVCTLASPSNLTSGSSSCRFFKIDCSIEKE